MFLSTRRAVLAGCMSLGLLATTTASPAAPPAADPLPSWNAGPAKAAITTYVARVTAQGPEFVPPPERIAVFDNDGTLWAEQPIYFQFAFAMERIGQMVAKDPTLRQKPAFGAIADRDQAAMAKLSEKDLIEAVFAVQVGLTTAEYQAVARAWFDQARHPRFHMPYAALTYQPQLELLTYLRGAGFKTYIVSGGEVQFMRVFAEQAYGVPPEQVIGSSLTSKFEIRDGKGVLVSQPALGSMDDGAGKPSNIDLHIGRAPLVAVGNSDGDLQMLQYSASSTRPSLQILVHHDDAAREYAYDRQSKIGKLDKALDEAGVRGWTVVSMKSDWKTVFASKP
ncbi:HAD family hydrolase [Caulobacter soli]|uniref:HAD family hydrolase n=1 Tax=Caulobacter soli TaxID=2708539 RepID=UPI0013EDCEDB|nr:HAD family hydrolase [Caulobacter soli]